MIEKSNPNYLRQKREYLFMYLFINIYSFIQIKSSADILSLGMA